MAQNEQLEFLRAVAACEQHNEREQPTDNQIDERHEHRQPPGKGAPTLPGLPATDHSHPRRLRTGLCTPQVHRSDPAPHSDPCSWILRLLDVSDFMALSPATPTPVDAAAKTFIA